MHLRKHNVTGTSAVGPYEWKPGADVTEVPDDLGADLLNLGGYEQVDPPEPEPAARSHHKAGDGDSKKEKTDVDS